MMFLSAPSKVIPMVARTFRYPFSKVHSVELRIIEEMTKL